MCKRFSDKEHLVPKPKSPDAQNSRDNVSVVVSSPWKVSRRAATLSVLLYAVSCSAETLGSATFKLRCTKTTCQAEVMYTADLFLHPQTEAVINLAGSASPAGSFGDAIVVPGGSYSITPQEITAYGLVSNQWESILPTSVSVDSQCVCPETANTCGETGIHHATRTSLKAVVYSASASNLGCSAPGDSIVCHKITSSSNLRETVFTILPDMTKMSADATVTVDGVSNNVELIADVGVPFGDGELFVSLYPSKVEPKFVNRIFSTSGAYVNIMPTTYTPTGGLWWGVGQDGAVRVPSIMHFASALTVEDNNKCSGTVDSSVGAHIYGALSMVDTVNVTKQDGVFSIAGYPGKVAVQVTVKKLIPTDVEQVTSVSCVASPKSIVITSVEGSFGFAYVKPLGCDNCEAGLIKLRGKSTTVNVPDQYNGVSVNLGDAVKTCTFHPQSNARMLSINPLKSDGTPVKWELPALSESGPRAASEAEVNTISTVVWVTLGLLGAVILYMFWATRLQLNACGRWFKVRAQHIKNKIKSPKSEQVVYV